jgi:1D-myo-inositol-triphosphate 3-kinase
MRDSTARPDLLRKMRSLDATAALPEEEAAGAITKLRYLKFREGLTTTRDLGFRVDAMKIGDDPTLNDSPLNFRQGPREPAAVLRELTRFVCASRPLAAAFAARLRALRCALEADAAFFPRYSLLRSSLLCTYDKRAVETATLSAPGPPVVGVHMIDFSSSEQARPGERLSHRAPWEPGNGEDGYLLGVDNLIKMFDKVERGEDWASESEDR